MSSCRVGRASFPLLSLVLVGAALGCSDPQAPGGSIVITPPPPPPSPPLPALIISEPAAASAALNGATVPGIAYASLPPGSIPGADSVRIVARRSGATARTDLADGGFDPVPVAALAGDTLDITVYLVGQAGVKTYSAEVPVESPPVIVRTDPPPGKPDVPLNAVIRVVFSEPMNPATLTSATVQLTSGVGAVAGTVAFLDSAQLIVTFTPAQLLAPATTYSLELASPLTDQGGDPLGAPVVVSFTTLTLGAPLSYVTYTAIAPAALAGRSRLVLDGQGRHVLSGQWPSIGYYDGVGTYSMLDGVTTLAFDWPLAGPGGWVATATERGDTLVIRHNGNQPSFPPFEDGVYVLDPLPDPNPPLQGRPAFTGDRDGTMGVYVANADGSGATRLADGSRPRWSTDGTRIAYVGYSSARDVLTVEVMNADGSGSRWLADGQDATWSPDDRTLVLSEDTAIVTIGADGSNRRVLAQLGSPGVPAGARGLRHPAWSPDGASIAFTVTGLPAYAAMGERVVLVMAADGSNIRPLSQDGWSQSHPAWSLDGTRIHVQTYDTVVGDPNGYDMVIAGYEVVSGQRSLEFRSHMQWIGRGLDVLPDGHHIVFSLGLGYGNPGRGAMMLLDLRSGLVRPLLPEPSLHFPDNPGSEVDWSRR